MVTLEKHSSRQKMSVYLGEDSSTPLSLVQKMISKIPLKVLRNPKSKFLDPCAGTGTFLIAIFHELRKYHSEEHILTKMLYACEVDKFKLRILKNLGIKNIYEGSFLEKEFGMKFDVVTGNPPYNLRAGDGGKSGTVGDKTFYRKFVNKAFEVCKEEGFVLYVTLKNVMKTLDKQNVQVQSVNMMTEVDYWKYNTLFFLAQNTPKKSDYQIEDIIIPKIFTDQPQWKIARQAASLMQLQRDNKVSVEETGNILLKLKGRDPETYGTCSSKIEPLQGPKLIFTMLESAKSYTVTDSPTFASCSVAISLPTLEEAEKLLKFVKNNKLFRYFTSVMKMKSHGGGLHNLKSFDLSQIETGYEYPREFELTQEEINLIESTVAY
jgi:predicted RNA methylase